jgi:HEAT repeat protein
LTDSSAEIRRRAARALGKIEDAGAVEALGRTLNDEDLEVRQAAIRALGDIEDASAVGWLIPALTDPNVEIRRGAARALGEIGLVDSGPHRSQCGDSQGSGAGIG